MLRKLEQAQKERREVKYFRNRGHMGLNSLVPQSGDPTGREPGSHYDLVHSLVKRDPEYSGPVPKELDHMVQMFDGREDRWTEKKAAQFMSEKVDFFPVAGGEHLPRPEQEIVPGLRFDYRGMKAGRGYNRTHGNPPILKEGEYQVWPVKRSIVGGRKE